MITTRIILSLVAGLSLSQMAFSQDMNTLASQALVTKATGKLDFGDSDEALLKQASLYHAVSKPNAECYMFAVEGNESLRLMVINHELVRAAVRKPGVSDLHGIQVGDSKERLVQQYAKRLEFSPHKYEEHAEYADVSTAGDFGLRYEIKQGKITAIIAGKKDAVILVEDCN